MITEQDVRQIIAQDYEAINSSPYPFPLPEWILDGFEDYIMETPQSDHPFFARTVKSILTKKYNGLTFYEGSFVCNIWNSVAPKFLSKDIDQFLKRKEELEKIIYKFNQIMKNEERKVELKQQKLMEALPKKPKLITKV